MRSSPRDLKEIRAIMLEKAKQGMLKRIFNHLNDAETISKCKEMLDHSFKKFQVCHRPGLGVMRWVTTPCGRHLQRWRCVGRWIAWKGEFTRPPPKLPNPLR